jgi:predicted nucleic acid-binding protein
MKNYVFDSFAMIAFFEDEPGAERVEEVLRELFAKKARGWMSVINWGEVYYCTYREQGFGRAKDVVSRLADYPIEVVDADQNLTQEAANLKGKYKVAYADCFAAALARQKKAEILTGDPEFKKFKEKLQINWIR